MSSPPDRHETPDPENKRKSSRTTKQQGSQAPTDNNPIKIKISPETKRRPEKNQDDETKLDKKKDIKESPSLEVETSKIPVVNEPSPNSSEEIEDLPSSKKSEDLSKEKDKRKRSASKGLWDLYDRFSGSKKDKTKSPKATVTNHVVAPTMEDLPDRYLKIVKDSKMDKQFLNDHYKEVLYVLIALTKDSFRMETDTPLAPRSERRPYACPELVTLSEKEMQVMTEKDFRKKYKNMAYSAKGGFGRVFKATLISDNGSGSIPVAIKRLPHQTEKQIKANISELAFLMHCTNHPNIVNYREALLLGNDELWIVTEFLEGGTLDFALGVHRFRETHMCYIAKEILNGLVYLHKQGFAHRDLKSANVMMSINGEVKIIDFGLCCDFKEGPRVQMLGSPFWLPPEMILKQAHNVSADIWSFGILVLELVLGEVPNRSSKFISMMNSVTGITYQELANGKHSKLKEMSAPLNQFLSSILVTDPSKRPTAKKLKRDPWFKSFENCREGVEKVLQVIFISNSLQLHGMY